jgi:hypothetical protein
MDDGEASIQNGKERSTNLYAAHNQYYSSYNDQSHYGRLSFLVSERSPFFLHFIHNNLLLFAYIIDLFTILFCEYNQKWRSVNRDSDESLFSPYFT